MTITRRKPPRSPRSPRSPQSRTRTLDRLGWFRDARLGLFCHYGLYALLGRGEWAFNREGIDPATYAGLADAFTAKRFSATDLADLAVELGAKYLVFTTKHHEGFALFDTRLTPFNAVQRGPKRDLVGEVVDAARSRGLRIGLYFSLNDWGSGEPWGHPSGLDAFEDYHRHGPAGRTYRDFIAFVHGQIAELCTNYGRIDTMWYDGWWPFDAQGWQAKKMNAMVRRLQGEHILFNNRNCLPGDFATPEQHALLTPHRVNEACFTLNDNWGFHAHDQNWKSPRQVLDTLLHVARGSANLLINVGPDGSGAIPRPSLRILRRVGQWVHANEEALRPGLIAPTLDWSHHVGFGGSTQRPGVVYLAVRSWPGESLVLNGIRGNVLRARFVDKALGQDIPFTQQDDRLTLHGLPPTPPDDLATVIALEHDPRRPFSSYQSGGLRVPRCQHPQYDPVDPNLIIQA